jgi:hypothetical protein
MIQQVTATPFPEAERLVGTALVRGVDLVPKGHTRIQTGFRYPDGSAIDLFLAKPAGLLADVEDLRITDFGNTISWLGFLGIDPFKPGRRR